MIIKIGLLTFPTVTNHGGYLQAFATYNLLKENGYDVEIINYEIEVIYSMSIKHYL